MAFFSGTDNEAIKQEATNCNHFLSLVVDTRGTYVARVTKRNVIKETIHQTIISESCYPTYDDKLVCSKEQTETTKDFVKETLEVIVYPLNIEVEKYEVENISEWDQDVKEAQATSSAIQKPFFACNPTDANAKFNQAIQQRRDPNPFLNPVARHAQVIADKVPYVEEPLFKSQDFGNSDIPSVDSLSAREIDDIIQKMYSESDIQYLVLQLLSGNPFIRKEHCNMLPQYAVKLPTVVKNRYSNSENYFGYIDMFLENLMEEFSSTHCNIVELEEDFLSMVSIEIQEVLHSLPKNIYINHLEIALNGYML